MTLARISSIMLERGRDTIQIGEKKAKLSLFAEGVILHMEKVKDSTKKTERTMKM